MNVNTYLIASLFLTVSCNNKRSLNIEESYIVKEIVTPCKEGGEPNLFLDNNNLLYLSWIEYLNDTTEALQYAIMNSDSWGESNIISKGTDWFVNWADFPSMVVFNNNSLAAHWLQKSDDGIYNYDIKISLSNDGGENWHPPFKLHSDEINAEHGFVSMIPIKNNLVFATWLDGRNTNQYSSDSHHHGHGSMTLRSATFDDSGNIFDESELDSMVCDCCQTNAVLTNKGVIIAYRDRSVDEIRDIYVVRNENGNWAKPTPVYQDNWKISGCPVNGPAIDAINNNVAIAWYTMPNESPIVNVAFSDNSGVTFNQPIRIDNGNPLGRVDIIMLDRMNALVSWIEEDGSNSQIKIRKVSSDGILGDAFTVSAISSSRQSGFPKIIKRNDDIYFTWTEVENKQRIKTIKLEKIN